MIERYTRPEMARLWDDAARFARWLEVELAVCEEMEARGEVPAATAARVRERVRLDPARILEIEATTRHDVIAFLTHVEEQAGEPARWLHLGMTSSDVLDTALAMQARDSLDLVIAGCERLRLALARRAREHRATPAIGRSHGMHAEPTVLGLTFALWYAEVGRGRRRLRAARESVAVGKIAGAVGNYAHLDPELERRALARLGLRPETVATQVVQRDRHAEVFAALALLGATLEKIALTVRHWQRTEVGEAEEPFGRGQKGSSAMPHKRNPILSENVCGLARLLRAYAGAALENVALWHERDISHSAVERVVGPDAFAVADFALARVAAVIDGLVVRPERLRANLESSGGLVFSEAVLLALVRAGLGRQRAYEIVQAAAMRALAGGGGLLDLLAADAEVRARLDGATLARCFDLEHHLRHAGAVVDRALGEEEAT